MLINENDLKNKRAFLALGNVHNLALIRLNSQKTQVKWIAPYQYDITSLLQPGINEFEVEVVNLWPNRLIWDGKLPPDQRYTRTNINKFNGEDSEKYLRQSGLIGPEKIKFVKQIILNPV